MTDVDLLIIRGYKLVMTCWACPEQYDVYDSNGSRVGYLRLRHGIFTAEYPDCAGELVYKASPDGDGMFEDDERDHYLRGAIDALDKHIKARG